MRLFLCECRRVLKSVSYWLFVGALVLFLYSQQALPVTEGGDAFVRPQPGDEQNVLVPSGDGARIMPEAAAALLDRWQANSFTTYPPPLCIYRRVTLNEQKHAELGAVLTDLYGQDAAALPQTAPANTGFLVSADGTLAPTVGADLDAGALPALRVGLTWTDFTAAMDKADRLLGGGSDWAPVGLKQNFGFVPASFEDLLAEYEAGMQHDRYTGAYARLFCDYTVIALALFGALPAVALFLQDFGSRARRGVADAVWSRRCPSLGLVVVRAAALAVLEFAPVLLMDIFETAYYAHQYGAANIALGAFLRYSVLWLLPTLLLEVAGGAALTLVTGTAAGAAVWPALGWLCVTMGVTGLSNGSTYGSLLTPRHNTVGKYLVYQQNLPRLLAGRGMALAAAAALLAAAVWALRRRRRGAMLWRFGA